MKGSILRLSLSLLLLVLAVPAGGAPPSDLPRLDFSDLGRELGVQARHQAALLQRPGVVGVGITYRDGGTALLVLVDPDRPRPTLPLELEGLPVVVEEEGEIAPFNGGDGCSAAGCHAGTYPVPSPMGVSTGPTDAVYCTLVAGTLGFKVCDPASGYPGYVTNNHVATLATNGCPNGPLGLVQQQPARYESSPACSNGQVIATAWKQVPISFSSNNQVDAAFAVSDQYHTSRQILDIGFVDHVAGTPQLNGCVSKSGRTTGLTHGRINAVNVTTVITYCGNPATFVNQLRISSDPNCGTCQNPPCSRFSRPGDSGSAIVDTGGFTKKVVGLLFAGSYYSDITYANPIAPVLSGLGVTLDLSQCQ